MTLLCSSGKSGFLRFLYSQLRLCIARELGGFARANGLTPTKEHLIGVPITAIVFTVFVRALSAPW